MLTSCGSRGYAERTHRYLRREGIGLYNNRLLCNISLHFTCPLAPSWRIGPRSASFNVSNFRSFLETNGTLFYRLSGKEDNLRFSRLKIHSSESQQFADFLKTFPGNSSTIQTGFEILGTSCECKAPPNNLSNLLIQDNLVISANNAPTKG